MKIKYYVLLSLLSVTACIVAMKRATDQTGPEKKIKIDEGAQQSQQISVEGKDAVARMTVLVEALSHWQWSRNEKNFKEVSQIVKIIEGLSPQDRYHVLNHIYDLPAGVKGNIFGVLIARPPVHTKPHWHIPYITFLRSLLKYYDDVLPAGGLHILACGPIEESGTLVEQFPISFAARYAFLWELIPDLLKYCQNQDVPDKDGYTPLMLLRREVYQIHDDKNDIFHVAAITALLQHGADLNTPKVGSNKTVESDDLFEDTNEFANNLEDAKQKLCKALSEYEKKGMYNQFTQHMSGVQKKELHELCKRFHEEDDYPLIRNQALEVLKTITATNVTDDAYEKGLGQLKKIFAQAPEAERFTLLYEDTFEEGNQSGTIFSHLLFCGPGTLRRNSLVVLYRNVMEELIRYDDDSSSPKRNQLAKYKLNVGLAASHSYAWFLVPILLEHGADPNQEIYGTTPLGLLRPTPRQAVEYNDQSRKEYVDAIAQLLRYGANLDPSLLRAPHHSIFLEALYEAQDQVCKWVHLMESGKKIIKGETGFPDELVNLTFEYSSSISERQRNDLKQKCSVWEKEAEQRAKEKESDTMSDE